MKGLPEAYLTAQRFRYRLFILTEGPAGTDEAANPRG
jgi:hypothetical protein